MTNKCNSITDWFLKIKGDAYYCFEIKIIDIADFTDMALYKV